MVPLILAALTLQSPLATEPFPLDSGPQLRVHRQATPLVALRLSAPVPTGFPEGSVELLQELARPEIEPLAERFGGAFELRHEGSRAVIAVHGPAVAFDALVAILKRATGEPNVAVGALRGARARAESRVLARLEQPAPRIRRYLRHGLRGGPEPRGAAATLLPPESVRRLRAVLYRPDRLSVVLVGAVPDPVIRSAFDGWPETGPVPDTVLAADTALTPARPQAHREWGGIAFPVEADPAVLAVTAELVQRRVRRSALRYGAAEAWYEPEQALALLGAATPGDPAVRTSAGISELAVRDSAAIEPTDVRRYLRRLVAEAAALAGPDAVARARGAVRRRLLLEARTAAGKAEVIGRVADQAGRDVEPAAFLGRVGAVSLAEVRTLLERVLTTPAVVAEAR